MDLFSEFDREVAMGAQGAIIGCPYLVNWSVGRMNQGEDVIWN